jgi:hypothetical protein
MDAQRRFQIAAAAYLIYGILYLAGAAFLISRGIGVRGDASVGFHFAWFAFGLLLIVLFPWLISKGSRHRGCLWFTRVLAALAFYRAYEVAGVARAPRIDSVFLAGDIQVPMAFGAWVFFFVTLTTAMLLAWASWRRM